jgi:transposase-like protein
MSPKNTRIGSQSKRPEKDSDKNVWKCKVCRKDFKTLLTRSFNASTVMITIVVNA